VKQAANPYVMSFQAQPYHKTTRYHWMICWSDSPDKLVSWGHAPTQEEAETAARKEVENLTSGLTQGGRVTSNVKTFAYRRR
jgi:hypothetical protein